MQGNRNPTRFSEMAQQDLRRKRQIRSWLLLALMLIVVFAGISLVRRLGSRNEVTVNRLPCSADQDVTIFGDQLLYYDGQSIQCLTTGGSIRWTFPVGTGARFSVSKTNLVIWSGTQLFIVDRNGNPTYNENMASPVQFARIGSRYCIVVVGEETDPELIVKNLDGTQIDSESKTFGSRMPVDAGFFGEGDQYMWTLSLDVYGVAINSVLNTFQIAKMNNGLVNLGEYLAYKVLYEDGRLRVFTTQQMYTYDYKGAQDVSRTQLVYGWELIDSYIPPRGAGSMLLAPTSQSGNMTITELRLLVDTLDRRYTLPTACVGAGVNGQNLYAISKDYLFHARVDTQRFYGYPLSLPDHRTVNSVLGLTASGDKAIVFSGDQVFAVSLPR